MRLRGRDWLGVLISGAAIWWLSTRSGIVWQAAWSHIRSANVLLILLAGVVSLLMFPLRAIRWGVILEPVCPGIPFSRRWRATAIGMMGNNILPFRGGEIARAWVLHLETPSVPFESAFASLFVDRAFDAFVVLLLLLLAMFEPGFPQHAVLAGLPIDAVAIRLGAFFVGLPALGLYALVFFPGKMIAVWQLVSRPLAPRFLELGERMLHRFADGLSVLRHPPRFARVLGWTTLHWLVQAAAFWISFRAIGVPASFFAALFVQAVIAFGVAIPSAPGFVGVFEYWAGTALGLYAIEPNTAAAWAIAYHAVSLVPISLLGLYYVWKLGISVEQFRSPSADLAPPRTRT